MGATVSVRLIFEFMSESAANSIAFVLVLRDRFGFNQPRNAGTYALGSQFVLAASRRRRACDVPNGGTAKRPAACGLPLNELGLP